MHQKGYIFFVVVTKAGRIVFEVISLCSFDGPFFFAEFVVGDPPLSERSLMQDVQEFFCKGEWANISKKVHFRDILLLVKK